MTEAACKAGMCVLFPHLSVAIQFKDLEAPEGCEALLQQLHADASALR